MPQMLSVFVLSKFLLLDKAPSVLLTTTASSQYYDDDVDDGATVDFNPSDAAVTIMNFVGEDLIDSTNGTNGTVTFNAYTGTQATVFVVCAVGSFFVLSGLAVLTNAKDIYSQRKLGLRKAHA